jgi:hypothetical protein
MELWGTARKSHGFPKERCEMLFCLDGHFTENGISLQFVHPVLTLKYCLLVAHYFTRQMLVRVEVSSVGGKGREFNWHELCMEMMLVFSCWMIRSQRLIAVLEASCMKG